METRKLVQSGLGSLVLSVPKDWLDQHHLSRGDHISVQRQGENLVLIPAMVKRRPPEQCDLDANESPSTLTRQLIAAYIAGCGTVVVRGRRAAEKERMLIQQIESLAGYELVEKTPERMVVHDVLRLEDLSVRDTFRRMDLTLRMMFDQLSE